MNYKDQYLHPKWQKKRLEILERDEFECLQCGDKETTLHVHHHFYEPKRKVWEYDNDDLVTFCAPCHEDFHTQQDLEIARIIQFFKKSGFDGSVIWQIRKRVESELKIQKGGSDE